MSSLQQGAIYNKHFSSVLACAQVLLIQLHACKKTGFFLCSMNAMKPLKLLKYFKVRLTQS